MKKYFLFVLTALCCFASCTKEPVEPNDNPTDGQTDGREYFTFSPSIPNCVLNEDYCVYITHGVFTGGDTTCPLCWSWRYLPQYFGPMETDTVFLENDELDQRLKITASPVWNNWGYDVIGYVINKDTTWKLGDNKEMEFQYKHQMHIQVLLTNH